MRTVITPFLPSLHVLQNAAPITLLLPNTPSWAVILMQP